MQEEKKIFKVIACYSTYCTAEIEADSIDHAYALAKQLDGDAFTHSGENYDWHINQVSEVD
jgi:(p)ppGpp synthase/HD superfamily hydrolase